MTPPHSLALGDVLPLARRLQATPDPLALYAELSDGGERPHCLLLESADAATGIGERSLLAASCALHLVAEAGEVTVRALSPNGEAGVAWLAARHRRDPQSGGRAVTIPFPQATLGIAEESERFRRPSPLDLLRDAAHAVRLASRPNPWCHLLLGALAYDLIDLFEELPPGRPDLLEQPLYEFWVPDALVVLDHVRGQANVVATVWGGPGTPERYHDAARTVEALVERVRRAPARREPSAPAAASPSEAEGNGAGAVEVDLDDAAFAAVVTQLQHHLQAGDAYQIVPSRTFSLPCPAPLASYQRLRRTNPSPYMFYLRSDHRTLFGASPERCVGVDGPSHKVQIRPIAGTAPRGRDGAGRLDPDADARNEAALRLDAKEMAEHLMLVDLARNDVARVSRPGTRKVARLLTVERYSHVMHLVSEVEGTLQPGGDALGAYAATMNMGTLVGAPKVRAAQILREVEASRRGFYGGAVGYLTHDGTLETCIVIRSALVAGGVAQVRAGAGVVLDSDPVSEARETSRKAQALLEAIAGAGSPAYA